MQTRCCVAASDAMGPDRPSECGLHGGTEHSGGLGVDDLLGDGLLKVPTRKPPSCEAIEMPEDETGRLIASSINATMPRDAL
jgi:hypothetical protein